MKIAIVNLTGGGISGGYKKYLLNIIPRLARHPTVTELLCASPVGWNLNNLFASSANIVFAHCRPYRSFPYNPGIEFFKSLKDFSPDILFIPVERFIRYGRTPVVNMVQNMEIMSGKLITNAFVRCLQNIGSYIAARRAIKQSDGVIAISEFVREYLVDKLHVPYEKISLIYYGSQVPEDEIYKPPGRFAQNLGDPFLFTAGSIRPARGLEDILSAMKILVSWDGGTPPLVIAGNCESNMVTYKRELISWIESNGLSCRICWAGTLSESEMNWCYSKCSVFVMTSRVESLSLTAIEALSHGCLLIAADNPCLPEIFKDAAIYYPPRDGVSLAKKIRNVLAHDDNVRSELAARARKRASFFSWDLATERSIRAFEKAIRSRGEILG